MLGAAWGARLPVSGQESAAGSTAQGWVAHTAAAKSSALAALYAKAVLRERTERGYRRGEAPSRNSLPNTRSAEKAPRSPRGWVSETYRRVWRRHLFSGSCARTSSHIGNAETPWTPGNAARRLGRPPGHALRPPCDLALLSATRRPPQPALLPGPALPAMLTHLLTGGRPGRPFLTPARRRQSPAVPPSASAPPGPPGRPLTERRLRSRGRGLPAARGNGGRRLPALHDRRKL